MKKQSILEIWGKGQPGLWWNQLYFLSMSFIFPAPSPPLNWPQEKTQVLLTEVHTLPLVLEVVQ